MGRPSDRTVPRRTPAMGSRALSIAAPAQGGILGILRILTVLTLPTPPTPPTPPTLLTLLLTLLALLPVLTLGPVCRARVRHRPPHG
eukprot:scaffold79401_cov21-Phaeocystis_antarctica.AAC.1